MIELILIILLVVLLLGRAPGWNQADPIGLLISILFVVLLVWLLFALVGSLPLAWPHR